MELRHLRYFVVIAEEENIMRAAERLHVAQSALSRQIIDLEKELGVTLFERQHRRIKLSRAGQLYLVEMRRVLGEIEDVNARVKRYSAGESGSLIVSLNNVALRMGGVSQSLRIFRALHPGVDLHLSQMYAPDQLEALKSGRADAAFVLHARDEQDSELEYLEVGEDRYILALPAANPLAARHELRLADLQDQPFLWKERADSADPVMAACIAGGLVPRVVQHVERLEMSPTLVAAGMGLAFVLSSTRYLDTEVVFRPVSDLTVSLQLDLMWRRGIRSGPLARFIETVERHKAEKATL